jgi:hypothetical protein
MTTNRVHAHTTLSRDAFVGVLTDFGPDRPDRWPGNDPEVYQVHTSGPGWAEVTEGSRRPGGVWQRSRYDWSTPGVVKLDVVDSNAFGAGSSWRYDVTDDGDGADVALTVDRHPSTVRGRVLDPFLAVGGRWVFGTDLKRTLRRLERSG